MYRFLNKTFTFDIRAPMKCYRKRYWHLKLYFISKINGYIYGNGPDFEVCSGEKVVFYAFGINSGIQTVTIYGGIQSWVNRR